MLTVAKVTSSAATGYANYLEGRSQAPEAGDYYLSDGGERVEAPGRWVLRARGIEALGVDPSVAVGAEAFRAVMHVQHPTSGEMLRRVGGNGEAVCAIDATFSAPKSVSAVWALSSPELRAQLEAAQETAVDRALSYATEQVPMIRRRLDQKTVVRERAAEVLASSWRHTTARAVAGRAPDPQLHSHVLIHGAVREDGRVVAVESRAWLVHQREVDAAYLSELAQGLQRLGFVVQRETGRRERYFELSGVPEGLRERFSGRHAQVQAAIAERLAEKTTELEKAVTAGGGDAVIAAEQLEALGRSGRLMPGEERAVAMRSRAAKSDLLLTAGDLDRHWWQDAQAFSFDAQSVEALRDLDRPAVHLDAERLDRRVLERLTEFDATFSDRDVRAAAMVAGVGLPAAEALESVDRLSEQGQLVALADGRLTTREHRALEAQAIGAVRQLAAARPLAVDPAVVNAELKVLKDRLSEGGGVLDPGQERAVRAACSDHGLVVIEGQAGTGKSTALGAVARAHEHAGQRVLVTSTGALAAERLASELCDVGVDAEACSTAALRARVQAGSIELDGGVTVIHDEAALASTREQHWLFAHAAAAGARVIEVGDPRQSQAVGAGGLWTHIQTAAERQGAAVALERIVRARDPSDRRCQSLWRSGQHERALAGYESRGRLVIADTQRSVEDRALEAAQADRRAGRSVLVICQSSNERLDELNARAQAIRAQAGELGDTEIPLFGRPYGLRCGDEVQVRAGVAHPELGRVTNGTTGHVVDVDPAGAHARLVLSDGRQGVFDRALLDAAAVRLAYVAHPFPAQGQTCEVAHVICAEHPTAEGSYVALTRAREHTRIYASHERLDHDQDHERDPRGVVGVLAERMGRTDPEVPSIAVPVAHEQAAVEHARESAPTLEVGELGDTERTLTDTLDVAEPKPVIEAALEVGGVAEPDTEAGRDRATPGRALVDAGRDRDRERVEGLRARRDRLRAVVDGYPAAAAREVARLRERAGQERETAAGDEWRTARWEADRQALGRLARHGQVGREARQRAEEFAERAAQERARARELDARAQRIAEGPDGPERWERAHPTARSDLHQAETELAGAVFEQALQREQQHDRGGVAVGSFDPAGARRELEWLAVERDRLRSELRGYPSHLKALTQQAEREATAAERRAGQAQERAVASEAQLAELSWLGRRGPRGDQLADHAAQAHEQAEREQEYARTRREHARELYNSPGGPAAWDRAHPRVRERLEVYEQAHGKAANHHARHQLQRGDRTPVERLLGERPPGEREDERTVWDHAAQALLAYRLAHLTQEQEHEAGLGPPPAVERRDACRGWEHARDQLTAAREQLPEPSRHGAELALDSLERHQILADELRLRGLDEDAIQGVVAVQIAQPHSPDPALQTPREHVDELARLARSRQHELDRGPSLGL